MDQIGPVGMRMTLNEYYNSIIFHIITENGLGTADTLTEDEKVHDDYRIDYLRDHIITCKRY